MLPRPKDSLEPSKKQSSKKRNRSNTAKENVATHEQPRASTRLLEKQAANTGHDAPVAILTSPVPRHPSQSPRRSLSPNSRTKRPKQGLTLEAILDKDQQKPHPHQRNSPQDLKRKLENYSSQKREQQEVHSELRTKLKHLSEAIVTILKNQEGERRTRELMEPKVKEMEENNVKLDACDKILLELEEHYKAIDKQLFKIIDRPSSLNEFKLCAKKLQENVIDYDNLKNTMTEIDGRMVNSQRMENDISALQRRAVETGWRIASAEEKISNLRKELQYYWERMDAGFDQDQVDELLKQVPAPLPFEHEISLVRRVELFLET